MNDKENDSIVDTKIDNKDNTTDVINDNNSNTINNVNITSKQDDNLVVTYILNFIMFVVNIFSIEIMLDCIVYLLTTNFKDDGMILLSILTVGIPIILPIIAIIVAITFIMIKVHLMKKLWNNGKDLGKAVCIIDICLYAHMIIMNFIAYLKNSL